MNVRFTLVALAAAALAGCAVPSVTKDQMTAKTNNGVQTAIDDFKSNDRPRGVVREIDEPVPDYRRTDAQQIRGDVNLAAAAAPFGPLLSELGRAAGYSVAFSDTVDTNRKVSVSFNGAFSEEAIRTTAFLAGYAAVIDKSRRTVMVSDVATYTFKLPSSVFTSLSAQYTVGGTSAEGGNAGSSLTPGSSHLKSDFSISGKENANASGLAKFLADLAGKNADVIVADSGHISVRANAQALRRVHDFLKGYSKDAMTQVEIEASVVEVSLTRAFSFGIQWAEVVNAANRGVIVGGPAAGALAGALTGGGTSGVVNSAVSQSLGGGISSFKVDASTSSLISALAQFTEVNIVSQPKLLSMNNVPATFFDGEQIPYLGATQQTPSTVAGGAPTVTGSVAFALDGMSFSAIPSVMDSKTVQITLVPVLSGVTGNKTFLNDTLNAPTKTSRQTYMRVLAESDKTLILGGIRYKKDGSAVTAPSSASSNTATKEVVILLRSRVLAAPAFDPIVNESL